MGCDLLLRQEVGPQRGRAGRGQLGEGHDVLEGDVGLGARVHQLRLRRRRRREGPGPGRPPQHLHHDRLLGRPERLHGLVVRRSG